MLGPIARPNLKPVILDKSKIAGKTGTESLKANSSKLADLSDWYFEAHGNAEQPQALQSEGEGSLQDNEQQDQFNRSRLYVPIEGEYASTSIDERLLEGNAAIPDSVALFGNQDSSALRSLVIDGVQPVNDDPSIVSTNDLSTIKGAAINLQLAIEFRDDQPSRIQRYYQPQVSLAQDRLSNVVQVEIDNDATNYSLDAPPFDTMPMNEKRAYAAADIVMPFADNYDLRPLVMAAATTAIGNLERSEVLA